MYRALDAEKIIATLVKLESRITERFPTAGLRDVAAEITAIARETSARSAQLARPNYALRALSGLILLGGIASLAFVARLLRDMPASTELFGMMQGIDAAVNLLLVMGAALLFLVTLEGRLKRRQALRHLHELRSIVHVIDMHQLTKDPSIMLGQGAPTAASQHRAMTPFELSRYLDYCSEMLSLTAKVAALYAQCTTDLEVVEVVNDIERLTTNLSSKIWQKIGLVDAALKAGQVATAPVLAPRPASALPSDPPRR